MVEGLRVRALIAQGLGYLYFKVYSLGSRV